MPAASDKPKRPVPDYAAVHQWELYSSGLPAEYRQCSDEGLDVEGLAPLFALPAALPPCGEREKMADALFDLICAAPTRTGYAYNEPDGIDEIFALCPPAPPPVAPDPAALEDKIRGAWLGRICGCLLGKPIENIKSGELHDLLRETGNLPLHRYIYSTDITDRMRAKYKFNLDGRCWADTVAFMPFDDDTNYTVLAQLVVDECGRGFTSADVGRAWLDRQPRYAYCTAERAAFRNLINGFAPPDSARFKNPYREYIGAQIRGDYFGFINPGDPRAGAEMAWRDARVSHVKNGIYGEMLAAAMIARAAVCADPEDIIRAGLMQIPASSRLYEELITIIDNRAKGMSHAQALAGVLGRYGEFDEYGWCHVIPNAAIVTAALLYGGGDYAKTICLAVSCGWDTDCNGATAGAVAGMAGGAGVIGPQWTEPLHGLVETTIFGVGTVSAEELVARTMKHIKRG